MDLTPTMWEMLIQARDFGRVDVDQDEAEEAKYLQQLGLLRPTTNYRQVGEVTVMSLTPQGEEVANTKHCGAV